MKLKPLRKLLKGTGPVMDVLVPPACWAGGSGAVVMGLSEEVRQKIALLSVQPFCYFCGLSVGPHESHDRHNPCGRCGQREVGVDRIARAGTFDEPLVTLIHRLKFGKTWELAATLAPFVYQAITRVAAQQRAKVDMLIPVPLHWRRRAARGFNQAEELARETAALGRWPVVQALRRTRHTAEQAMTDSVSQRRENLRGAFACKSSAGKQIAGRHVWLIDDVSTTGATLHAAASALRRLPKAERPASISAAVVCVTDHQSPSPPQ